MDQKKIPDFTDTELRVGRSALKKRYGKEIEPQRADTEVMLSGGSEFYIYYHPKHQLDTGIDGYDEISDGVIGVRHVESDHIGKTETHRGSESGVLIGDSPDHPG